MLRDYEREVPCGVGELSLNYNLSTESEGEGGGGGGGGGGERAAWARGRQTEGRRG